MWEFLGPDLGWVGCKHMAITAIHGIFKGGGLKCTVSAVYWQLLVLSV